MGGGFIRKKYTYHEMFLHSCMLLYVFAKLEELCNIQRKRSKENNQASKSL